MSSWKKQLLKQGMKWMSDPRVAKLLQDERVTKAVMAAMSAPAKAQSFAREHVENLARAMALATEVEVQDLRRTVQRLQAEVERLRSEQAAGAPGDAQNRPK